jgi:hypothetical protein
LTGSIILLVKKPGRFAEERKYPAANLLRCRMKKGMMGFPASDRQRHPSYLKLLLDLPDTPAVSFPGHSLRIMAIHSPVFE